MGTGPSGQEGWGSTEDFHNFGDIGKETHIEEDIQEGFEEVTDIEREIGEELQSEEAGHIENHIEEETHIVGHSVDFHS